MAAAEKKPKKKKGKTPKKKKTQPAWVVAVKEFFANQVVRFVSGAFFGILAIFTLVSLISYLFTWAQDQSMLSEDSVLGTVAAVENWGGRLGLNWSNLLVSHWFGLGAFVFPFFFGGISIFCFKRDSVRLLRLFFLSLMGAIVLSATCSYIFSFTSLSTMFGDGAGGSYGHYIIDLLKAQTGAFGTACIVFFLLFLWIVLLNTKIVGWINALFNRMFAGKPKEGEETSGEESEETEEEEDCPEEEGEDEEYEDDDEDSEEEGEGEEESEEEDSPEEGSEKVDGPTFEVIDLPIEEGSEEEEEEEEAAEPEEEADSDEQTPAEPVIPPVNVIPSDSDDFSAGLTDEQWKTRYDPRLSLSFYKMPALELLNDYAADLHIVSREELEKNNRLIVSTLKDYRIEVSKVSARVGPTVTLYEVVPAPGVRVAQIMRLEDDIARSLAARGVRVTTLVGTNAVGIEVANEQPSIVSMKGILADPKFNSAKYDLPVVIGRTISNEAMSFDLAKMPHLLVAGATGQGKSVGLNAIIASLLYKKHPAELKFVLVDPKKVELSLYSPLEKHYLAKLPDSEDAIITDTKQVVYTLRSLCKLMDHRYDLLKKASVRNVKEYNEKFLSRRLNPYKGHEYMPYIVVIIDEFADLLMTAGREVEEPIARLAQLARAIGIHLVIATQRPTTNIITGTIKANFPARIAFRVISGVDSKTILDQTGANQLIGRGDMLISTGNSEPVRVQCAFIDTPEVEKVTQHVASQAGFGGAYLLPECDHEDTSGAGPATGGRASGGDRDELFKEAARLIVREQAGSTSLIQRKMNLGYNRAGRIMDQLEEAGIVGPPEGSRPRQVRVTSLESLEEILRGL